MIASRFGSPKVALFMARVKQPDLNTLKDLIESKKVTPVVDRCFPFEKAADAFTYLHDGHPGGKVVVTLT
jgi:NADPH:quinone reductase-like Zn-dependent oxidoreductase